MHNFLGVMSLHQQSRDESALSALLTVSLVLSELYEATPEDAWAYYGMA